MTRSFTEIEQAIAWQLQQSIGEDRFDMWFGCEKAISIRDGQLLVSAGDDLSLTFVRQQFESVIHEIARNLIGNDVSIQFTVNGRRPTSPQQASLFSATELAAARLNSHSKVQSAAASHRPTKRQRRRPAATNPPPASTESKSNRQQNTLKSFWFGKQNRLLETAIEELLLDPGKFNPLYLFGPVGCGKSHLLQAVVESARRNRQFRRCVCMTSEQFTTGFIDALQRKELTGFRRKHRNVDLLAVDDIQFLAGKQATIIEFQNTLESLLRQGKQVIVAADRPAMDLQIVGDQIAARLSSGLACPVAYPDQPGRLAIVKRLARERQCELAPSVMQLVSENIGRDVRLLYGAVNRLQAYQTATGQRVDLESAAELMSDLFQAQHPVVSLAKIEQAVCDVCGVQAAELKSGKRIKRISHARMLAMWLSREYTSAGLAEIGKYYGNRSHSTVVAARKKINFMLDEDAPIEINHRSTNITSAVGRLRSTLQVG